MRRFFNTFVSAVVAAAVSGMAPAASADPPPTGETGRFSIRDEARQASIQLSTRLGIVKSPGVWQLIQTWGTDQATLYRREFARDSRVLPFGVRVVFESELPRLSVFMGERAMARYGFGLEQFRLVGIEALDTTTGESIWLGGLALTPLGAREGDGWHELLIPLKIAEDPVALQNWILFNQEQEGGGIRMPRHGSTLDVPKRTNEESDPQPYWRLVCGIGAAVGGAAIDAICGNIIDDLWDWLFGDPGAELPSEPEPSPLVPKDQPNPDDYPYRHPNTDIPMPMPGRIIKNPDGIIEFDPSDRLCPDCPNIVNPDIEDPGIGTTPGRPARLLPPKDGHPTRLDPIGPMAPIEVPGPWIMV